MNIFDIINVPLGWIMRVCYTLVNNYFIALLLFALIMQIILLPLSIKQQKNSVRQATLSPKIMAIRKKYAGRTDAATQQKMQEETMELYKRENFNPAGGCFPLLIQMPILLSLYNVVMNPLRYVSGLSADRINELKTYMTDTLGLELNARGMYIDMMEKIRADIAAYTDIAPELSDCILPSMSVGPFDLAQIPEVAWNWLLLVPIVTFVVAYASQKITRMFTYQSPENAEAANSPSMKIMNATMPLLSVWIAFSVPAAIGMYWIFRNIITTVQQILLSRMIPVPHFTEEDYRAAEKEMKVKPQNQKKEKSKIPPRSLHHIDDEEYEARRQAKIEEAKAEEAAKAEEDKPAGDAPALKEDDKTSFEKK